LGEEKIKEFFDGMINIHVVSLLLLGIPAEVPGPRKWLNLDEIYSIYINAYF